MARDQGLVPGPGSSLSHVPIPNSKEFQDFRFEPYEGRKKEYILFDSLLI